jgi:carboxylesterase type B
LPAFRDLYGITDLMRKDRKQVAYTCVTIMGDIINNVALHNYCSKMTANGSTVYRYVFMHTNPANTGALSMLLPFQGATHTTELMYLFDVNMFITPWRRTKADRQVLNTTTRLWTNFAKYGNPNGDPIMAQREFDFNWEPVTSNEPERHLLVQNLPVLKERLDNKRIERLGPLFEHFLP